MSSIWVADRQQLPHPEIVEVSKDGPIGLIEMNEPERLNPLGANEIHIHYALQEMHADPAIRAVIITGRGRAFCAGADIRPTYHKGGHDEEDWSRGERLAYRYTFGNMWETLHSFRKPTIAAVNGYCLGGGWEVAHLCDFVIAADDAVFGAVEINVGLPPFANTCNYLTKMVGIHKALEWTLNATKIDAKTAYEHNLVNKVVPRASLMDEAMAMAKEVASRPPITVFAIRQLARKAMNTMEDYDLERALAYFCMTTEDAGAARTATAQRQPFPEFNAR
ncbi:MAG: enoyl-CoA hydratase/isomerase family protein [Acidimicrobiales bacterium]|nr:enoyl-CoA hydratase/isomerase family protein [Acidimicrobiales bacterium]